MIQGLGLPKRVLAGMRANPGQVAAWQGHWRQFLGTAISVQAGRLVAYRAASAEAGRRPGFPDEHDYKKPDPRRVKYLAERLASMLRSNGPYPEAQTVFEVGRGFYDADFLIGPLTFYYASGQLDAYIDLFVYFAELHVNDDIEMADMPARVQRESGTEALRTLRPQPTHVELDAIADDEDAVKYDLDCDREWSTAVRPDQVHQSVAHIVHPELMLARIIASHFELGRDVQFAGISAHLQTWLQSRDHAQMSLLLPGTEPRREYYRDQIRPHQDWIAHAG